MSMTRKPSLPSLSRRSVLAAPALLVAGRAKAWTHGSNAPAPYHSSAVTVPPGSSWAQAVSTIGTPSQVSGNFWFRLEDADAVNYGLDLPDTAASTGARITAGSFFNDVTDVWVGGESNGASNLTVATPTGIVAISTWYNVRFNMDVGHDLGARTFQLFVGNSSQLGTIQFDTGTSFTFDYTVNPMAFMTNHPSGNMSVADIWFKFGTLIDWSVGSTSAKFINGSGKPVDLGADGTAPGLGAPDFYFSRRGSAAASTFPNNLGTGGPFTLTGPLTNASTSPSD